MDVNINGGLFGEEPVDWGTEERVTGRGEHDSSRSYARVKMS
jgi:hypothetical protein